MTLRSVLFHIDDADAAMRFVPPLLQFARDHQIRDLVAAAPGLLPDPMSAAAYPLSEAEARKREMFDLLETLQTSVRDAARGFALDFRSAAVTDVTAFLLDQAGRCDLTVVRRHRSQPTDLGQVDLGRFVLQAGRPVLIVPREAEAIRIQRVVVGFKPCREARLALAAGLPLVGRAERVLVAALGEGVAASALADAVDFLGAHGVPAEAWQDEAVMDDEAGDALLRIAAEDDSDLIVAGAYGRGPVREAVFGGVTRSLLRGADRPCLLIH